ncbi:hypothetical protein EVAR_3625_1 [Eumeta japonica]|uniref:Uncharacterized protein n=1 Tax=Eumeta variegata TaxID=151549 RepID=A0A4C1SVT3_EUMVA|nr:hypothetical protein EVAR_3625_1 [Eumeta japonica]
MNQTRRIPLKSVFQRSVRITTYTTAENAPATESAAGRRGGRGAGAGRPARDWPAPARRVGGRAGVMEQ